MLLQTNPIKENLYGFKCLHTVFLLIHLKVLKLNVVKGDYVRIIGKA